MHSAVLHLADVEISAEMPTSNDQKFEHALSLTDEGRYLDAATAYRELVELGEPGARLNLANLLADRLDSAEDAIEQYREALNEGSSERAPLNLGMFLTELKRWTEAREMLELAVGRGVEDSERAMGWFMEQQGHHEDARTWYERAIAHGDAAAWGYLGGLLNDLGDASGAEAAFRSGIDAGATENYSYLGALLGETGRREEAESLFLQALEADVKDVLLEYGNLLSEWPEREEEAMDLYRLAIEAGNTDGYLNLAQELHFAGRPDEAEAAFLGALNANDHFAHRAFGHFLVDQGRVEEGEEQLKLAEEHGYSREQGT